MSTASQVIGGKNEIVKKKILIKILQKTMKLIGQDLEVHWSTVQHIKRGVAN
jgi:hypothetical protein